MPIRLVIAIIACGFVQIVGLGIQVSSILPSDGNALVSALMGFAAILAFLLYPLLGLNQNWSIRWVMRIAAVCGIGLIVFAFSKFL